MHTKLYLQMACVCATWGPAALCLPVQLRYLLNQLHHRLLQVLLLLAALAACLARGLAITCCCCCTAGSGA
jgi:hypothetical protein